MLTAHWESEIACHISDVIWGKYKCSIKNSNQGFVILLSWLFFSWLRVAVSLTCSHVKIMAAILLIAFFIVQIVFNDDKSFFLCQDEINYFSVCPKPRRCSLHVRYADFCFEFKASRLQSFTENVRSFLERYVDSPEACSTVIHPPYAMITSGLINNTVLKKHFLFACRQIFQIDICIINSNELIHRNISYNTKPPMNKVITLF